MVQGYELDDSDIVAEQKSSNVSSLSAEDIYDVLHCEVLNEEE